MDLELIHWEHDKQVKILHPKMLKVENLMILLNFRRRRCSQRQQQEKLARFAECDNHSDLSNLGRQRSIFDLYSNQLRAIFKSRSGVCVIWRNRTAFYPDYRPNTSHHLFQLRRFLLWHQIEPFNLFRQSLCHALLFNLGCVKSLHVG